MPEWIQAQYNLDRIHVKADPKAPGSLVGDVVIDSDGGPALIHVSAIVDQPVTPPAPRIPRPPSGDRYLTIRDTSSPVGDSGQLLIS